MPVYLRNGWYVAAFSDEVSRTPMCRTLLEQPVVLYRKEDGSVAALHDRCPHRFAPLSRGVLHGDDIQCPYHGLRFDAAGRCVFNPHGNGATPAAARVEAFHVTERYGFVWYWPGDPAQADPSLIPNYWYLEAPEEYSVIKGLLHVKGNYQLVVDNLLDLSHVPYIHPHFKIPDVTPEQTLAATTTRLDRSDDKIFAYRMRTGLRPNPATCKYFDFPDVPSNSRTHMTWYPPSLIDFDNGTWLPGTTEREGFCLPQAHCITPETETTSHYFFAVGRNMKLGDKAIDDALMDVLQTAFRDQDEPMIEAVQQRMGPTGDLESLKPVFLQSDGPPAMARRLLAKRIAQEAEALEPVARLKMSN